MHSQVLHNSNHLKNNIEYHWNTVIYKQIYYLKRSVIILL
jgi:hypothetical protein